MEGEVGRWMNVWDIARVVEILVSSLQILVFYLFLHSYSCFVTHLFWRMCVCFVVVISYRSLLSSSLVSSSSSLLSLPVSLSPLLSSCPCRMISHSYVFVPRNMRLWLHLVSRRDVWGGMGVCATCCVHRCQYVYENQHLTLLVHTFVFSFSVSLSLAVVR